MKTSTAETKKEHIGSVCCRAGFIKMVLPLDEYLVKLRGGAPNTFSVDRYWIPVQTCSSCGKECEVEYIKPE